MRRVVLSVAVAGSLLLVAGGADAKDLGGRVGVGYVTNLPAGPLGPSQLNAIAARYWVNKQIGIDAELGYTMFDPKAGDSVTGLGLGLGVDYAFIDEPNLHVYGTGLLSFGQAAVPAAGAGGGVDENTAIGVQVGLGTEFFMQGLPNLGWTTQFGLSYSSISDYGNILSLGGADFATLGIRYYFGGPTGP